ncbi:DUF1798 family protein [Salinicoccus sp. HZC-1]|uniref:DUF1798 family protein n=1 Tax=Salinicoccus sp. HZC-1 TaxID=3385497 RepID=UPI00398B42DD
MAFLSRIQIYDALASLLDEVDARYKKAKEGYEFDFEQEVAPFLDKNKDLVYRIEEIGTDARFDAAAREKVVEEFLELLMSCHAKRFSKKMYKEKFKFINMWIQHAHKEGLIT